MGSNKSFNVFTIMKEAPQELNKFNEVQYLFDLKENENMKTYKIIKDCGINYAFLEAFGHEGKNQSWVGQIVKGNPSNIKGCIIVEKPFGISGTWTADEDCFEEIK